MTITNFIDERLDLMLAHPEHWGGAEAFESQVLLLLELQEVVRANTDVSSQNSLRQLLDGYVAFLRPLFPDLGPRPLSSVLNDQFVIATALEQFRASLKKHPRQLNTGVSRHTDGFYVATTADGVGICDTKRWPADRSTILDGRMLRAVDNRCPPSERQFHCGACNARFSRPPETLVLMFVDLYSNVIPACSETCGQQLLARGTQRT